MNFFRKYYHSVFLKISFIYRVGIFEINGTAPQIIIRDQPFFYELVMKHYGFRHL